MRSLLLCVLAALPAGAPGRLTAQAAGTAVARTDVHVRSFHSRGSSVQVTLAAGDTVTLLAPRPVAGYYDVRTRAGVSGWTYGRYLRILARGSAPGGGAPAVAAAVDSTWPKPAPDTRPFDRGPLGTCGPDGKGGDTPTNHRKNRIDEPTLYHPVSFAAVAALPYPRNHEPSRRQWSAADLTVIAPYEGVALTVTGFIARQRGVIVEDAQNSRTGETTNCNALDDAGVDWHLTLVPHPGDPKSAGIVMETTPRVRAQGHPWTPDPLTAAATAGDSVRISGWLMYDPEHFAETTNYDPARPIAGPKFRATLWEIHPITKLEVFDPATHAWRTLP